MIGVMIVPTGIGAEIGGHAGDATPAAKLLAAVSDKLILHPNVVNASDINEMPHNALYVDGYLLDCFLNGTTGLREVRQNRILVAVNAPVRPETVNAVSAARVTLGADISILELERPLQMIARRELVAGGNVLGWRDLVDQVGEHEFDALAIATPIECDPDVALAYFEHGGVNPWGGVEAMASRKIASELRVPTAHAPVETVDQKYNEIVDPRIAAEMVSRCFLHCVLKGLHRAPRWGDGLSVQDVDFLVSPWGCWGMPHMACSCRNIPIIMVRENQTVLSQEPPSQAIVVENYLEAAGVIAAMRAGITRESVRRPIPPTRSR